MCYSKSPSSPLRLNIIWKWVQLRPDPAMFTAVVIFITPLAIRGCILHRFFNFALLKFSWIRWLFDWKECFRKFSGDISDCTQIFQITRHPAPVPKYWKKITIKKAQWVTNISAGELKFSKWNTCNTYLHFDIQNAWYMHMYTYTCTHTHIVCCFIYDIVMLKCLSTIF